MTEVTQRDLDRFFSRVDRTEFGCWQWTGGGNGTGYGKFRFLGKSWMAHRFSYVAHIGEIPVGLDIDHTCHNRGCVNPEHLRTATRSQNLQNISGAHRDSKSGIRGVDLLPWGKWRGQVMCNGERYYLGCFDTREEAEAAVTAKRIEVMTHNDQDRAVE